MDLRPVPIDFTLDRIYNLFPDTPENSQLRAQWLAAEIAFYTNEAGICYDIEALVIYIFSA